MISDPLFRRLKILIVDDEPVDVALLEDTASSRSSIHGPPSMSALHLILTSCCSI